MNTLKRSFALLLCLTLVLGMATTVFASEYQYEVFQIFTGTIKVEDNTTSLTDIKWGVNGKNAGDSTVVEGDPVPSAVLEALEAVNTTDKTREEKLAVILNYADLTGKAFGEFTTNKIENLPNGYYLVKDKSNSLTNQHDFYTVYVVEIVNGTLEISRKGNKPEVNKWIQYNGADVTESEASIGESIDYKLVGTVPENIAEYDTYFYKFDDTAAESLTISQQDLENLMVTINGVDVTQYFYKNAKDVTGEDGTTKVATNLVVSCPDILALQNICDDITKDTKVIVTYTATLNDKALVGAQKGNKNDVKLIYSNDPNVKREGTTNPPTYLPEANEPTTNAPVGETPKSTVITYTTEIEIVKVDQTGAPLTGAEFTLSVADGADTTVMETIVVIYFEKSDTGTYYKLKTGEFTETAPTDDTTECYEDTNQKYIKKFDTKIVSQSGTTEITSSVGVDGKLIFRGLGAGKYTITESKTPEGYNGIQPFDIEITWDKDTDAEGCVWSYSWPNNTATNSCTITVQNQKGATLPTTGGIGTTLFYGFGFVMVAAAIVLLVTKKRMHNAA